MAVAIILAEATKSVSYTVWYYTSPITYITMAKQWYVAVKVTRPEVSTEYL